jgi:hypothetical protein
MFSSGFGLVTTCIWIPALLLGKEHRVAEGSTIEN